MKYMEKKRDTIGSSGDKTEYWHNGWKCEIDGRPNALKDIRYIYCRSNVQWKNPVKCVCNGNKYERYLLDFLSSLLSISY